MGQIIVNGNIMGESNDEITIRTLYTEETGVKIAEITINGTTTPIYAPKNEGGN